MTRTGRSSAIFALAVLTAINLLNYLDRYIGAGMLPRIEQGLHIGHDDAGWLMSAFFVAYMLASPLGGYLGDRIPRRFVVAGGVFLWSAATIASGLSQSYHSLLGSRAMVGIGEAGYAIVGPAIIADLFPRERRTRMLAYFYTAIPVGAAMGYALGGWLGEAYSWHTGFFVGGAPGLVLAVAMLFAPEPERGAYDEDAGQEKVPFLEGLRQLSRNAPFWFNTIGLTLMTFSIGGLANFMPTFLVLERGMKETTTGTAFGAITAGAGLVGTLAGGWLGDWADRRRAGGGMWISGVGLILAAPMMYLSTQVQGAVPIFFILFVAQFLLFINNGPINAGIVNCVPPTYRAFAVGLSVLCYHLFGDAISPPIIGALGKRVNLGFAIQMNTLPVVMSGVVLLLGASWTLRAYARPATGRPGA